jgi:multimeric flavodoxin WrbA
LKVLGLHGSPRRGGNSEILLDAALKGAVLTGAKTRKVHLAQLRISGCLECNDCYADGECSTADDMDQIYEAFEWADRIIFSSPIFFMGLPAQAKAAVDRAQRYWALKYVLKQPFPREEGAPKRLGIFLGVGATRGESLFEGVVRTIKSFFDAIDVRPVEDLYVLVRGVDEKGAISQRQESLDLAMVAGEKLARMES